jgi:hypothetical protein
MLVNGLGGVWSCQAERSLVCCNYVCVLIPVHGVLSVHISDEMRGTDRRHWVSG